MQFKSLFLFICHDGTKTTTVRILPSSLIIKRRSFNREDCQYLLPPKSTSSDFVFKSKTFNLVTELKVISEKDLLRQKKKQDPAPDPLPNSHGPFDILRGANLSKG